MPKKQQLLLPQPSSDMSLSKYGYSTNKPLSKRRTSLKKASKRYGKLTVLRRLNLIRNLSKKGSEQKGKMSKDVEFMKKLYKKEKKFKKK